MLRVKERMKVEFSRSITPSVLALFHRTGHALKMVLTNRYTCTPQRRLAGPSERTVRVFPLRGGPSSRPTSPALERDAPGDGPRSREERPGPGRRSEWRRRQASLTASAFLGVGGEIHTLMSSPGPRPRGGMMPRNDTWRGRGGRSRQRLSRVPHGDVDVRRDFGVSLNPYGWGTNRLLFAC